MKKFTTIKTLLVGLCAMGAMSAWAGNYNATLTHTASSFCSADANSYTSTVDAAKEHVNNAAFNSTWQGAAYAEFAISIPSGESITSATLTFLSYGETRNERNCDVMVANTGGTLNYTDLSAGTAKVNLAATKITSVNFAKGDGAQRTHEIDVTNAVKSIIEAEQDYIVFKFTGNPGGGDIAGKNTDGEPTLVIVTADASTQTKYTVKFTDGTNDLKDPVVYDGTIGENATASSDDMAAFVIDGTKWVYKEGNETITLGSDAENNVITLTFREAAKVNYTLTESTTGKVLAEGTDFENETVTAYYPHYILDGENLFECTKQSNNPWYGVSIALGTSDATQSITYSQTSTVGVIYVTEGEDIPGISVNRGGNYSDIRSFGGAVGYASEDITLTTLPAGKYIIKADLFTPTSAMGSQTIVVGGETFTLTSTSNGYHNEVTTEAFTLTEETEVILQAGGGATNAIDWLYIQALPDEVSYVAKAVDENGNELFTIGEGTAYKGENATVIYPAFYLKEDGELLQAERINDGKRQYQYSFAVPGDGTEVTVVYKSVGLNDVVFYKEAEDIETLTPVSSGNAPIRCSNGKGGIAEEDAVITSLPAGLYTISSFAWGNPGTTFTLVAGDKEIASFSSVASTMSINKSAVFELTETTDIVLKQAGEGGSNPKVLDYIFIQEVPSTVELNVTAGYATYCSEYALYLDGIEAYTATISGTEVTFVDQMNNTVAPGTGLLIKAKGNVTIPIAAEGETVSDNALIGVLKNTKVGAGSFVLMSTPYVGFFKASNEFTVGANTAYLPATASARIVLPGSEATAIKAIETEQSNEIYNLAGQRVKSAQKGLYIIGGKKVIK